MRFETKEKNGRTVACVYSETPVICDVQSALDLLMRVRYETESTGLCINKEAFCEEFFVLSSGIAGEILQKFVTYQTKLAIYGDYSRSEDEALERLAAAE